MSNPKVLNLDELELIESDVTVIHNKVEHRMATLTVEAYLKQQARAAEQERLERDVADSGAPSEEDTAAMVKILRDGISDFFPTLPVGELPTQRLFQIFAWLNELSMQINEINAAEAGVGEEIETDGESAEGNVSAAS